MTKLKIYILTDKTVPSCSHEIHVIIANGIKEVRKIASENHIEIRNFEIEEKEAYGLIYTDVY